MIPSPTATAPPPRSSPSPERDPGRARSWIVGLVLPPLLLTLLTAGMALVEYRSHACSRWLGGYLLSDNDTRVRRGAIWKAILANRQARARLEHTSTGDTVRADAVPAPVLRNRYTAEWRTADFLVLVRQRRQQPLGPRDLSPTAMRDLATSLQVYQRGRQLLAGLRLAREPFVIHARILAQLQLQDGSLFAVLRQRLRTVGAPQSWDFVRMSDAARASWKQLLEPALTPGDPAQALTRQAPTVARALATQIHCWADSLQHLEAQRLRATWDQGPDVALRLVRSMDVFMGYAVTADERPVPFEVDAQNLARIMYGYAAEDTP